MRISDWSSDVCSSDLIVFCLCIALFGFIAGSFLMYRDVFPATYLAQSYQGGLALLDKATGYEDPLATDLWNPARTDARGVTIYDPERAANGLTPYTSGHAQEAFLMDMQDRRVPEGLLPHNQVWDATAPGGHPRR